MSTPGEARIAALEQRLAELESALAARPAAAATEPAEPASVSRRRLLLTGGGIAAGAAGAVLATPSPASAATPATDVTFTPTGNVSATNVQNAIVELDNEKAALAGATFTGPVTVGDARFGVYPIIDVRAHGATGNGTTDDTGAINSAISTAVFIGGGTVFFPPGRYRFGGTITVPNSVDLWGSGGHGNNDLSQGTVLRALNSSARLVIQGTGGTTGNLLVDGQKVADPANGLVYIDAVERNFVSLRVANSRKDGIVIEKTQNCVFTSCWSNHHDRDGFVLDLGAGGNAFIRCELGFNQRDTVVIRQSGPTPPDSGAYANPQHNLFLHCIFEGGLFPDGANNTQLNVTNGAHNKFSHCVFSLNTAKFSSTSGFLVQVSGGSMTVDDCLFSGDLGAIWNNGGGVHFTGRVWFNTDTAVRWEGNAFGDVLAKFSYGSAILAGGLEARWYPTSPPNQAINNQAFETDFPILSTLLPGANFAFRTMRADEPNGYRFQVGSAGQLQVGDGTSFSPKAEWKLGGAGWETPNNVHLNGGTLAVQALGTAPTSVPTGRAVLYVRGSNLVVAFNDGGTMRYKYLSLNGTTTTWSHSSPTPPA